MGARSRRNVSAATSIWIVGLAMSAVGAGLGVVASNATHAVAQSQPVAETTVVDEMAFRPRPAPSEDVVEAPTGLLSESSSALEAISFRPKPALREFQTPASATTEPRATSTVAATPTPSMSAASWVRPSRSDEPAEPVRSSEARPSSTVVNEEMMSALVSARAARGAPIVDEAPKGATDALLRWMGATDLGALRDPAALHSVIDPRDVYAGFHPTQPYLALGLPGSYFAPDRDAALGLMLATQTGCRDMIDGPLKIAAGGDPWRRQELETVCASLSSQLRTQLEAPPEALRTASTDAWRFFRDLAMSLCTPEEKQLMAVEMAALYGDDEQPHQ